FLTDGGIAPERVRILPNAVDTERFCPDVDGIPIRRRLNLEGQLVIGFAGTFKPWHGLDLLLEAFGTFHTMAPSSHLLLIGDGPLKASMDDMVRRAGLEQAATFVGSIAHEEMPTYLAAVDIAIAPYPALDSFYYSPLKLFEYMAMGRAIVAS